MVLLLINERVALQYRSNSLKSEGMNSETLLVRVMKLIVLTFLARYVVWHNHRAIRTDLAMDYHSWHRTSYL